MGLRRTLYSLARRVGWPRVSLSVRVLVVDDEDRVCLVRHTYRDGWFLPGGNVKSGESVHQAAARELTEETGIQPAELPRVVHGVFSTVTGRHSHHIVVFTVTDWMPGPGRSVEIAEVGFFDPAELPDGTSAATVRRVKEHVTGVPPQNRW